jgi:hypothetical protein
LNRKRLDLVIVYLIFNMIIGINVTGKVFAQPKPKIVVDSAFHDYGEVLRGEKVSHTFVIKNQGNATLIIKNARPG